MNDTKSGATSGQSDVLLWVAGALIAGVAAAWLLLAKPWSSSETRVSALDLPAVDVAAGAARPSSATGTPSEDRVSNPLRMAELAYDAGMLLEPEGYSAWNLYQRALELDPNDSLAHSGLMQVADDLLVRGTVAQEQGRLDDAKNIAMRILEILPDHRGALALDDEIDEAEEHARAEREREAQRPEPARAATPAPSPREQTAPAPEPDRVAEAYQAFEDALAANRLLTPQTESASHFATLLETLDPDHDLVSAARGQLFDALLVRARQAVESLDAEAAAIWLAEAERLDVDPAALTALRETLTSRLIAAESARPVPASALVVVSYARPQYPMRALDRRIEGWVDVEFTVDTDGATRDVAVTDASHTAMFRGEATRAVEQWRFEPREFMGQTIEQRSYTRIRFAIEE